MDDLTKEQRSRNMSHIRSSSTKPEEMVRKRLFSKGFRYRKNVKGLPGTPDIVLKKYNTAIFVHGCFWHMHDCGKFRWPSSNQDYWTPKILGNVERDKRNQKQLEKMGWNVLVVWECELSKKKLEETMNRIEKAIVGGRKINE